MATLTTITVIDDLDGGEADETMQFTIDGTTYEIDLNAKNAEEMRVALARYVDAGRRVSGRATPKPKPAPAPVVAPANTLTPVRRGAAPQRSAKKTGAVSKRQRMEIRAWARSQGYQIGDQGRISREIMQTWEQAGKPKP